MEEYKPTEEDKKRQQEAISRILLYKENPKPRNRAERRQAIKEYQHNYYLQVTKPKRQEARKNVK